MMAFKTTINSKLIKKELTQNVIWCGKECNAMAIWSNKQYTHFSLATFLSSGDFFFFFLFGTFGMKASLPQRSVAKKESEKKK